MNRGNINKMYEIMTKHYENLKTSVGLREAFDEGDSEEETEQIFNKLRPSSPYKFKELIQNKFDPKKFNRLIGKPDEKMS